MIFGAQRNGWTFFLIMCLFVLGCLIMWCFDSIAPVYGEYVGWIFIGLSLIAFWEYATTRY